MRHKRHTYASWLAINGVGILTIKELLGHKSIKMTLRYAHLSPDNLSRTREVLADYWHDKTIRKEWIAGAAG